eukprot:Lithocolla_globosa_v1_NODE_3421_length_1675_cov_99.586420.p2 type:complete len:104 gc:universal NODE_3421_length_1675_cov_99.586420:995-1306(+)
MCIVALTVASPTNGIQKVTVCGWSSGSTILRGKGGRRLREVTKKPTNMARGTHVLQRNSEKRIKLLMSQRRQEDVPKDQTRTRHLCKNKPKRQTKKKKNREKT